MPAGNASTTADIDFDAIDRCRFGETCAAEAEPQRACWTAYVTGFLNNRKGTEGGASVRSVKRVRDRYR